MLVVTRKVSEQILIGDDIKITLVRVKGNSVRIGIEAPRQVRVIRSELTDQDSGSDADVDELSERESVFAHPQPSIGRHTANRTATGALDPATDALPSDAATPQVYFARVRTAAVTAGPSSAGPSSAGPSSAGPRSAGPRRTGLGRAPLAGFVSAT